MYQEQRVDSDHDSAWYTRPAACHVLGRVHINVLLFLSARSSASADRQAHLRRVSHISRGPHADTCAKPAQADMKAKPAERKHNVMNNNHTGRARCVLG